jgi:hypothetical protein
MRVKKAYNVLAEAVIRRLQMIVANYSIARSYEDLEIRDQYPSIRNALKEREELIEAIDLIGEILEVDLTKANEFDLERFR